MNLDKSSSLDLKINSFIQSVCDCEVFLLERGFHIKLKCDHDCVNGRWFINLVFYFVVLKFMMKVEKFKCSVNTKLNNKLQNYFMLFLLIRESKNAMAHFICHL